MKKGKTKKRKVDKNKIHSEMTLFYNEWQNIIEYTEEEIDDMIEENHIPEISYIDAIEKPEEIIFE